MSESAYEVYAIKYATREAKAYEHFYGHIDPHEDYSMPMDYYIWVIRSKERTIVVDTGFTEEVARQRKRDYLRCPVQTLEKLGIHADQVSHVIITHLHYDHAGNAHKFPKAKFILQESEMAFWTGKYASRKGFRITVEVEDIVHLVRENFAGRIWFVDGDQEIFPGIHVYKTGGHSPGLQFVTVQTAQGTVILASDVTHYYKNIEEDRPIITVHNLADMYYGFDRLRSLVDNGAVLVPGHDPEVMNRFAPAGQELDGIIAKIS